MSMVGSRGTAARTIIEDHDVGIIVEQRINLREQSGYALRLMATSRQSEVHWQNREWIYQEFQSTLQNLRHLTVVAISIAEKTRTLGNSLLVDVGTSRHYACRIELRLDVAQLLGLDMRELLIVEVRNLPYFELAIEETLQTIVGSSVEFACYELLASRNLERA